jgi:hypothetical protein
MRCRVRSVDERDGAGWVLLQQPAGNVHAHDTSASDDKVDGVAHMRPTLARV